MKLSAFKFTVRGFLRYAPFLMTGFWLLLVVGALLAHKLDIEHWELLSYNFRFHQRGSIPPDDRLVFVAIDDESILGDSLHEDELKKNPEFEMLREFPYHRRAYALAIERLVKSGARVVVFDLLLTRNSPLSGKDGNHPHGRMDDETLRRALAKYHDKVVIGANFNFDFRLEESKLLMPNERILPSNIIPDNEIVGFVNYMPDADGFIRGMHPVLEPEGPFKGLPNYSIDALAVKKAFPEINLPPPSKLYKFIDFYGPNGTFKPYPFWQLFDKRTWEQDIPPFHKGIFFKDKIVLIGPRANSLHDEHLAPFGDGKPAKMYGPEIHMNAMATLLSGRNLREMNPQTSIWLMIGIAIIFGIVMSLFRSPLGKLIPSFGCTLGYAYVAQMAFEKWDLFIPLVPVEIILIGSSVSVITLQAILEQIEKRRVTGMFQRYVSRNVADELIKSGEDVNSLLIPRKRTVTVLFSDVRDFTTMTENNEPGPFVQQLNEYLTEMVECVFNYKGTVDKFVGDAVMAVFGSPNSAGSAEDAWRGVQTALEMRARLAVLNQRWEKEGRPIFRIGIGLNHGDVMAGDIGSSQKKEFGVIGDTVNTTARVESLTKEQKTDILITDSVYQLVKDKVDVESRGSMHVKGRAKEVEIYSLIALRKA